MSDLPSREQVAEAVTFAHITDADGDLLQDIANAYVEGRLVDREAIDQERIEEILDELCRDWYDMVIREGKTYDFGAAIRALAAAIGDTG